jgi:hypothetical protein
VVAYLVVIAADVESESVDRSSWVEGIRQIRQDDAPLDECRTASLNMSV